jgi:hypothetical protein
MSQRLGMRKGAARDRFYREVLGIRVGDMVTTSYGTGPYEVWAMTAPRQVTCYPSTLIIRTWPVVDLALVPVEETSGGAERRFCGINDVRKVGDRWFTDRQDEVWVQANSRALALPIHPLYSYPPLPEPYAFQQGVDYRAGHRQVWHCARCGRDWNEGKKQRWETAWCPACQGRGIAISFMHDPSISQSECVLAMNA